MISKNSKRILFYSHDAYGMGNIRRTLAICERLTHSLPDISILILTGSPVIHALRIPRKVDYIKLPCLTREKKETFCAKYWDMSLKELMRFRADLLLSSIKSFRPNLIVVDKKPLGIKRELLGALRYIRSTMPDTRIVLGLRDILDAPENTIPIWKNQGYFKVIAKYYDQVWIYGSRNIFDAVQEYRMPDSVADKVVFTGYLGKPLRGLTRQSSRALLGLNGQFFTLVMVGGGGDGYPVLSTYIKGVGANGCSSTGESLLVAGPEMPREQRRCVETSCHRNSSLRFLEFSDEIENYIAASDVVVSMGGYNTTCEILAFRKRAVIIPRVRPVQEQFIRARRLAELGLVNMVHPDELTPSRLLQTIEKTANQEDLLSDLEGKIDLDGLERIERLTKEILMTNC